MRIDVKVPQLAESIEEAVLLAWRFRAGDAVKEGDTLVELETDKVVLEVTAHESGVLAEIIKKEGSTVKAAQVIAVIDTAQQKAAQTKQEAEQEETTQEQEAVSNTHSASTVSEENKDKEEEKKEETSKPVAASPSVRKLLREHGLDAGDIKKAGDRITKADVTAHLATRTTDAVPDAPKQAVDTTVPAAVPITAEGNRSERRVPISQLRKRVAARLLASQHETATLTTFNEVDMQPVMALRTKYKDLFEKKHGGKLGFMSFFTTAAVRALQRFPAVNAYLDGNEVIYHDYCDIGIAMSTERGLIVPIVRNAEQLNFSAIEKAIVDFAGKAKNNSLRLEDLSGGTFSITNGGIFGSLLSTPILNPPQSAILGMHKIEKRAVVQGDAVVVRPMMYLALSYDHRIIDGREAVSFLVAIKEMLEDPARLLLDV